LIIYILYGLSGDWCRSSKKKKVEENKALNSYKRQVDSLTNKNQHLQRKLQKLKKKLNKLKLKQTPQPMALPLPLPPSATKQQQQQNQVMYVPVLTGVFTNRKQNVATKEVTTTSFHTPQQGDNASAITSLPITTTGLLLPPPSGGSNI
jgi:regulator of replication initiation timing